MITLLLNEDENICSSLANICTTTQSHITLAVVSHRIIAGALGPEFFKLYDTGCCSDADDFAIRIPTRVMKTLCTTTCSIQIDVDAGIRLLKMVHGGITMGVSIPLEQDFNQELIADILSASKTSSNPFDISAVGDLRPLVAFANSGLQCKKGLAYVIGPGFTAYRQIENELPFIMTRENISEFVKFAGAHKSIGLFECGIYTVFSSGQYFFGCKQPRSFVDSEYESYCAAKPLFSTHVNLTELCFVMKTIGIPKGENPKCDFDMDRLVVHMDLGNRGRYAIAIGIKDAEPVQEKAVSFKILTESLKCILSNSSLKLDNVVITVYKSFIAIQTGGNDFLLVRE